MSTQSVKPFYVIGISIRTTNENGQSAQDIPALWHRFLSENIAGQITNKVSQDIYCLYTDYEKDHTRPYTTLLGYQVSNLDYIPAGLVGKNIDEANYAKYVAKGNLHEGTVFNAWTEIWNSDLPRAFQTDFEIYGEKAQNPQDAEVDIFIGLR
ncbi:effector binding domain-containing protein [Pedobacter sp. KR3-3]|uniref:Effector binding domain-containing protein n=1 Tax=Pedobacter albus TaxID=3113905 RepID=A0ABU7I2Y2_9SPHI|nr:effector binding domain-containing protein [Pedobacter sp. KR3-3]MEE1943820.1 effector binding domain-containing protein [Pedobacter sp. KR3-3]